MTVSIGEQFLMVPLYLYAWDLAIYEDWLLLGAAAGAFVRFIDFGLERYYSASLRMSFAAERYQEFDRHLATGLAIYLIIATIAGIAISGFVLLPVRNYFGLTAMTEPEAALVFWCMVIGRLTLMPKSVIKPIYAAHGHFSRGENMHTFTSIAQTSVLAIMLALSTRPSQFATISLIALFFTNWLPVLVDQYHRYPGIHRKPVLPSTLEVRQALRKSKYYMARDWGDIVILQLPILLIGYFADSPGSILIFRLTRILTGLARQLTVQLAKIGGIEMSRQLAQRDRSGLISLYLNLGRSVGATTGLICAVTAVIAEPLIEIWTGGKAPFDQLLLFAFVAGVMIGGPAQNAIMLLTMSNVPRPLATGMVVQVTLLVSLMAVLIPKFGALGAGVALGFSDCIYSVWASYAALRYFKLPEHRYAAVSFGSELLGFGAGIGVGLGLRSLIEIQDVISLGAFSLVIGMLILPILYYLALTSHQRRRAVGWISHDVRIGRSR